MTTAPSLLEELAALGRRADAQHPENLLRALDTAEARAILRQLGSLGALAGTAASTPWFPPIGWTPDYTYPCTVLKFGDGDTVKLRVDLGLDTDHRAKVRLTGLDTPETWLELGKRAKAATYDWLTDVEHLTPGLVVRTDRDLAEKFGRYLGTIYAIGHPESLNAYLLREGYARPYDGGKR